MGTYEYQDASQLQRLLYIKIEKSEPTIVTKYQEQESTCTQTVRMCWIDRFPYAVLIILHFWLHNKCLQRCT